MNTSRSIFFNVNINDKSFDVTDENGGNLEDNVKGLNVSSFIQISIKETKWGIIDGEILNNGMAGEPEITIFISVLVDFDIKACR